jgi:general secretion pathway protein K
LLVVLIALAVVSLIVATVVEASRRASSDTLAQLEQVRLRAAMDGATATVARDFAESGAAAPDILVHPQSLTIGDTTVRVSVRPESAKIDINSASPALLHAFLIASGLRPKFAERIADEIADWRDADSTARPHGAETADYLFAGRSYGAANRNFESVSELGLLLDGSENLVACLAPDVTVFTGRRNVEQPSASPRVRTAAIAAGGGAAVTSGVLSAAVVGGHYIQAGEIFEVTLQATDSAQPRQDASRRIVLRVTGNPKNPVWLLSQMAPAPHEADSNAACARLRRAHPD